MNEKTKRRTFLRRFAASLGGLFAWRAFNAPIGASIAATQPTTTPDIPGYLAPRYLPADYQYITRYTDRLDGFGGGSEEVALWYTNPKNPLAFARPLAIYQTPAPRRAGFATTAQRLATTVTLLAASGKAIAAKYHDGCWISPVGHPQPLAWDTNDVHSLTFTLGNLTIGLRGSRVAGVTKDELIRVASSLL